MKILEKYGATARQFNEATMFSEDLSLARITAQYRGLYKLISEKGEFLGEISGKMRHLTDEIAKYPAVGDFVMVAHDENDERVVIHEILTRKSVFLRRAVGVTGQAQVVASNIDIVFICMSLNENYNLSRLERYLAVAWDSGATPIIILTKSDLCENLAHAVSEAERVSGYADVYTSTNCDTEICEKLQKHIKTGVTSAFIGSSGVGKSTLINMLLGENVLETADIGRGDKGRHTTTGREMFVCKNGGVLIDTPGMRELGADGANLSMTFDDIEKLAENCKFTDCTHTNEPNCAVLSAIDSGELDMRRLESYKKLKLESGYEGLNSKEIETKKHERMFKEVGGMKNARNFIKENSKRKGR